MAGKSTIMRQVALISLLAQIGSFVPAKKATIGLYDRIFVRVGASDDLTHGRSTFMVEMSETAFILHHATNKSLILLDEIGRGTSTFDGLSIAWAVAESVHDTIKARCIFATHYHELTVLADQKENIVNMHVAISERKGDIVFLRTLHEGGTGKSYGIQCAKLAGMPRTVLKRSKEILSDLEKSDPTVQIDQLSLFDTGFVEKVIPPDGYDEIQTFLEDVNPDEMTPREALDKWYALIELKRQFGL
jgi:DNA mismatch repair protein MutS